MSGRRTAVEINWFTFIAQIVNFLILVAILQRFLYRPVVRAMDHREQTIRDRLAAAQERQTAEQLVAEYRRQQQALDDQREILQQQTKAEVEQLRQSLIQTARQEVEATQQRWQAALERQQEGFLQELRHRTLQQVQVTLRKVLREMADVELERQMIGMFLKDLKTLPPAEKQTFRQAIATPHQPVPLTVYSSFKITATERQRIVEAIQAQGLAEAPPSLPRLPTCSVALSCARQAANWPGA